MVLAPVQKTVSGLSAFVSKAREMQFTGSYMLTCPVSESQPGKVGVWAQGPCTLIR